MIGDIKNYEFLINVIGQVYQVNGEYKNDCVFINDINLLNNIKLFLDEAKSKHNILSSTEFFQQDIELYGEINFIIDIAFYKYKAGTKLPHKKITINYRQYDIIDENKKWIKNMNSYRQLILSAEEKQCQITLEDILYATSLITNNKINEPIIKFDENRYEIRWASDSDLIIYFR